METYLNLHSDIIILLSYKITDYKIITEVLKSLEFNSELYNRFKNNIRVILSNSNDFISISKELVLFPNLEVIDVTINVTNLNILPYLRKIRSLRIKLDVVAQYTTDTVIDFLSQYCKGNTNIDGVEYINNRDLKNVDFKINIKIMLLLILIKTQCYCILDVDEIHVLDTYAFITGIWSIGGRNYYKPKNDYTYHEHINMDRFKSKTLEEVNNSVVLIAEYLDTLREKRFKIHIISNSDRYYNTVYITLFTEIHENIKDTTNSNIVQYDVPIIISDNTNELNEIIEIFPNVNQFMVIPSFATDKKEINYNDRIFKYYRLPGEGNIELPEIKVFKTLYDAMLHESNL